MKKLIKLIAASCLAATISMNVNAQTVLMADTNDELSWGTINPPDVCQANTLRYEIITGPDASIAVQPHVPHPDATIIAAVPWPANSIILSNLNITEGNLYVSVRAVCDGVGLISTYYSHWSLDGLFIEYVGNEDVFILTIPANFTLIRND